MINKLRTCYSQYLATKSVNDTVGYDGLVPKLLVLVTYSHISNTDVPTFSTAERARAIKSAMTEIFRLPARRKANDKFRQRNGPKMYDDNHSMLDEIPNHEPNCISRRSPPRNQRLPRRDNVPDIEINLLNPSFKKS